MLEGTTLLIGDLVGSRGSPNRRELQTTLRTVLKRVNSYLDPVWPLEPTVGDEFQGGFRSVAEAARASLIVRLDLLREVDVDSRYGLGYGDVAELEALRVPRSQDGPGWWSARDSIVRAKVMATHPRTSFVRTCFTKYSPDGAMSPGAPPVESFLLCRDATVDRMSERARRLLLGIMVGIPQADLARNEQITQGAVSQNLKRSGAFAIAVAHNCLDQDVT